MKKILLLGGSTQQIPAIKYANAQGYYTVLCDYLPDNPGQEYSDKFYCISTTDKDAILAVAKNEKVDGVVAYASDPAAPTAAYVAEIMNLPTNPYKSVEILSFKDKFRNFLSENNFNSPKAKRFSTLESALQEIDQFVFPVMVKPIDSSGSKGVRKVEQPDGFDTAFKQAMDNTRDKKVIVEEFIVKDHPYMIGGDCFVVNGKVESWGLLNCFRDSRVNNLVPIGKSYPLLMEESRINKVKNEVQRLFELLNIKFGGFNLEIMVDKNDNVYFIEVGPRNGGNLIPELLLKATGDNMVAATIDCAMGLDYKFKKSKNIVKYLSTYQIHSHIDGVLQEIHYKNGIEEKIDDIAIFIDIGSRVQYFNSSNMAIGIVFLEFDNHEEQIKFMQKPEKWIDITVKQG